MWYCSNKLNLTSLSSYTTFLIAQQIFTTNGDRPRDGDHPWVSDHPNYPPKPTDNNPNPPDPPVKFWVKDLLEIVVTCYACEVKVLP